MVRDLTDEELMYLQYEDSVRNIREINRQSNEMQILMAQNMQETFRQQQMLQEHMNLFNNSFPPNI